MYFSSTGCEPLCREAGAFVLTGRRHLVGLFLYIHAYLYLYLSIYLYVYIHIYVCIYMYTYIHIRMIRMASTGREPLPGNARVLASSRRRHLVGLGRLGDIYVYVSG